MKNVINTLILLLLFIVGCNDQVRKVENNRILQTLVEHNQDSLRLYFKQTNLAGNQKFEKHISYSNKPDSIALYYRSVDTLQFKKPITKKC